MTRFVASRSAETPLQPLLRALARELEASTRRDTRRLRLGAGVRPSVHSMTTRRSFGSSLLARSTSVRPFSEMNQAHPLQRLWQSTHSAVWAPAAPHPRRSRRRWTLTGGRSPPSPVGDEANLRESCLVCEGAIRRRSRCPTIAQRTTRARKPFQKPGRFPLEVGGQTVGCGVTPTPASKESRGRRRCYP